MTLALLAAKPAGAQTRPTLAEQDARIDAIEPSLAEQQARLDALEASHCAAWDLLDGSGADPFDFRPFFCPASCGCQFDATGVDSCLEESPGVFVASRTSGACLELGNACSAGYCEVLPNPVGGSFCDTFSGGNMDCPAGEECRNHVGAGSCQFSGDPCDTIQPNPCPLGETCIITTGICFRPCTSQADCTTGESICDSGPNALASCQDDSECLWQEELVRLSGVGPAGSEDPVTCDTDEIPMNEVNLNNNDALACLAIVETELGQACTPAP